jgi:hypothetical protein
MAQNKRFRFGPVALLTALTTNILNGAVTSMAGPVGVAIGQPYILLNHLHVVNKTATPATVSLWVGATGGNVAGTELGWQATSVPANSALDLYFPGGLRLDSADFLVGGSGATTALTLQGEGEIGIA